jgi:hypothetical protein
MLIVIKKSLVKARLNKCDILGAYASRGRTDKLSNDLSNNYRHFDIDS